MTEHKSEIRTNILSTFDEAKNKAVELRSMLLWLDEAVITLTGKSVYKLSDSDKINAEIYHSLEDGLSSFGTDKFREILYDKIKD